MSANRPALIVVTGLPCTGKSALAAQLCARTGWPLLAKDDFKERLFATLGSGDRASSKLLSRASYALMFNTADELLGRGQAVIMEGNFRAAEHNDNFAILQSQHSVQSLQIFCRAKLEVMLERLRTRAGAKARHPGHRDLENLAELEAEAVAGTFGPLMIKGHCLHWDSSQPDAESLATLLARATAVLQGS